jgi:hypothetical protein
MKKIRNLPFRVKDLRNAEHFLLHWSLFSFLSSQIVKILMLIDPWNIYHVAFKKEDAVYKRSQKLKETKEITFRNRKRNNDFMFFGTVTTYESHSTDPARQAAAERLIDLHSNYKEASKKALGENTALITNFLQDLDEPQNKEAVDLLELTNIVESLRNNNRLVEQLYDQRSENLNYMREEGNMLSERNKTDKAFEDLVSGINAAYIVNEYGDKDEEQRNLLINIINGVNARIKQTSIVFSRRQGRRHKSNNPEVPEMLEIVETPKEQPVEEDNA